MRHGSHFNLTTLAGSAVACAAVLVVASGLYTGVPEADWMAESNQLDAHIGESVAAAGDVNGDGYADIIVGTREYDDAFTDEGIAWVFYGGPGGPASTPDVILHSPQPQTYGFFGEEVASAGDVNGDGYDDVMVSMTNYDGSQSDEGAVFVYYGGASGLDPTHDWFARGDTTWAHLGWGMGPAGDVNGDGYDDIIVGGFEYTATQFHHALVFHGSPTGLDPGGARPVGTPGNADWIAVGDQSLDAFGIRVGCAGDLNGDGYDDVFVGAPNYDDTYVNEGAVFIWHGSAAGLGPNGSPANADWYAHAHQADVQMGGSGNWCDVGCAGDVNGDGYDDLIIGARLYDNIAPNDGIAMLWYGSAVGLGEEGTPANADWVATGQYEGDTVGGQVASARDFNGDGYDDVLIGGYGHDLSPGSNTNEGMALIWFGGEDGLYAPGLPYDSDVMIEGDQASSYFGLSLAGVGDVNGDGCDDVFIGACYYDHGQDNEGVIFGFYGQPIVFHDDFDTGDPDRWARVGP